MDISSSGIGDLIYQSSFAIDGSSPGRYAARLYRPVIYSAAMIMILLTAISYGGSGRWVIPSLLTAALGYTVLFVIRMRMSPRVEEQYYRQRYQFMRGQLSLVGVAFVSAVLLFYDAVDHELWILYILSLLIISEHNSSRAVALTLAEVVFLIFVIPIVTLVILKEWTATQFANTLLLPLVIQATGITLVTFVNHYFIRNIQGRKIAVEEYQRWEEAMSRSTATMEDPHAQLSAITGLVEGLTRSKQWSSRARLWLVRLPDARLTDGPDEHPSRQVIKCLKSGRARLALSVCAQKPPARSPFMAIGHRLLSALYHLLAQDLPYPKEFDVERNACLPGNVPIEITIPITLSDGRVIGIIDVLYDRARLDELTLSRHCHRLLAFAGYAQVIVINATRVARFRQEEQLSESLRTLHTTAEIADQVAIDLTKEIHFAFAAVWLVDHDAQVLRCSSHQGAPWAKLLNLPLRASGNSLAVQAVLNGYTVCQAAPDEGFNRHLRRRYQLDQRRRMYVPLPASLPANSCYPAAGVIEVGFHPGRKGSILPDLVRLLETYAYRVGLAMAAAESLNTERQLNHSLTLLLDGGRDFIRKSSYYTPYDMAELIGESARAFLRADIPMVYRWDEVADKLELVYPGPHDPSIYGNHPLTIKMEGNILNLLYRSPEPYIQRDARNDPYLNSAPPDGSRFHRSFTQRQNIKSFAGLQLVGAGGGIKGFLCLNFRNRRAFPPQEVALLKLFALQAGVALEEVGYQNQTRDLLQARERVALAAELHHHMSQNLYALRMHANTTAHYAALQSDENLQVNSTKVVELAGLSQKALGHMIGSLNQSSNSFVGFVREMETQIAVLQRFNERICFHLEKQIEGSVPEQVEFYLYRIAIEALSNAVRHARAANIYVQYCVSDRGIVDLIVRDDGHGMVENKIGIGHGRDAMRYFAAKIRARVDVDNVEGQGTSVSAHFQPFNA
jgi:signal transduction histidine kinase